MVNVKDISVVFFVSTNGLGPTIITGCVIERLSKLLSNLNTIRMIFKTNCKMRFEFIKQNYLNQIDFNPEYEIKSTDLVIHIIDPRNIPSKGYDVFIDNMGDYWHYIFKHKMYTARLQLYFNGIMKSKKYFLTSFISKGINKISFNHFCFVDKFIINSKNKIQKDGIFFIGSFKLKNISFDDSFSQDYNLPVSRCLDRLQLVDKVCSHKTIITHPGINSICESFFLNKPFFYIHPANTEQKYNAWIIKRYGLGLVFECNNRKGFKDKLNIFNKNYDMYAKNIFDFISKYNLSFNPNILDHFLIGVLDDYKRYCEL